MFSRIPSERSSDFNAGAVDIGSLLVTLVIVFPRDSVNESSDRHNVESTRPFVVNRHAPRRRVVGSFSKDVVRRVPRHARCNRAGGEIDDRSCAPAAPAAPPLALSSFRREQVCLSLSFFLLVLCSRARFLWRTTKLLLLANNFRTSFSIDRFSRPRAISRRTISNDNEIECSPVKLNLVKQIFRNVSPFLTTAPICSRC